MQGSYLNPAVSHFKIEVDATSYKLFPKLWSASTNMYHVEYLANLLKSKSLNHSFNFTNKHKFILNISSN